VTGSGAVVLAHHGGVLFAIPVLVPTLVVVLLVASVVVRDRRSGGPDVEDEEPDQAGSTTLIQTSR
jgi:hypothetical protein